MASSSAASMALPLAPQSSDTHGSSPITHLSWPGGISKTEPAPISSACPPSMTIRRAPEIVYPTWRTWHDEVPTNGRDIGRPAPAGFERATADPRFVETDASRSSSSASFGSSSGVAKFFACRRGICRRLRRPTNDVGSSHHAACGLLARLAHLMRPGRRRSRPAPRAGYANDGHQEDNPPSTEGQIKHQIAPATGSTGTAGHRAAPAPRAPAGRRTDIQVLR